MLGERSCAALSSRWEGMSREARFVSEAQVDSVALFLSVPGAIINVADLAVAAGVIGLAFALAVRVPGLRMQPATVR